MAFPTISAADTQTGAGTSNSTTLTLTYPTNLASGDLILALVARDGALVTGTWPSGWSVGTGTNTSGSTACVWWARKVSDGTETGTFDVTSLSSEQGPWRVMRIPAATWSGNSSTGIERSTASSASGSTAPDSNALNPTNWDAEDTLWISVAGCDGTPTFTGFPTNYTQQDHTTAGGHSQSSGGTGGAGLGVAFRQLNAASEDPGAFTLSAAEEWGAFTLGIRPAAAAAYKPVARTFQPFLAQ